MTTIQHKISLTFLIVILLTVRSWNCLGQNNNSSIKFIVHGISFGMCEGYCYSEEKFDSIHITTYSKSWDSGEYNKEPDKFDTLKIDSEKWNGLVNSVNLSEFYKLPQSIGCPDCADGGSEWVEIGTIDKVYRVKFEYGDEIEWLIDLMKLLRQTTKSN